MQHQKVDLEEKKLPEIFTNPYLGGHVVLQSVV